MSQLNNNSSEQEKELIYQLFKKVNLIIYNQERTKEDVENAKNIIEQISEKNDDKTIKIILSNYRRYVNKRALLNIINNFNDIDDITYIISIIVNMYDLEKKDIILIINALVNKIFSKDFLSELWRIVSYLSLPSEVIENIYINIKNKKDIDKEGVNLILNNICEQELCPLNIVQDIMKNYGLDLSPKIAQNTKDENVLKYLLTLQIQHFEFLNILSGIKNNRSIDNKNKINILLETVKNENNLEKKQGYVFCILDIIITFQMQEQFPTTEIIKIIGIENINKNIAEILFKDLTLDLKLLKYLIEKFYDDNTRFAPILNRQQDLGSETYNIMLERSEHKVLITENILLYSTDNDFVFNIVNNIISDDTELFNLLKNVIMQSAVNNKNQKLLKLLTDKEKMKDNINNIKIENVEFGDQLYNMLIKRQEIQYKYDHLNHYYKSSGYPIPSDSKLPILEYYLIEINHKIIYYMLYVIENWRETRIDQRELRIKEMEQNEKIIEELKSSLSNRNVQEQRIAIEHALNTIHSSGQMIEHYNLDKSKLDFLSNMDTSTWDKQLQHMANKNYKLKIYSML